MEQLDELEGEKTRGNNAFITGIMNNESISYFIILFNNYIAYIFLYIHI